MTVLKLWRKSWSSYNSNIRRGKTASHAQRGCFFYFSKIHLALHFYDKIAAFLFFMQYVRTMVIGGGAHT